MDTNVNNTAQMVTVGKRAAGWIQDVGAVFLILLFFLLLLSPFSWPLPFSPFPLLLC